MIYFLDYFSTFSFQRHLFQERYATICCMFDTGVGVSVGCRPPVGPGTDTSETQNSLFIARFAQNRVNLSVSLHTQAAHFSFSAASGGFQ